MFKMPSECMQQENYEPIPALKLEIYALNEQLGPFLTYTDDPEDGLVIAEEHYEEAMKIEDRISALEELVHLHEPVSPEWRYEMLFGGCCGGQPHQL